MQIPGALLAQACSRLSLRMNCRAPPILTLLSSVNTLPTYYYWVTYLPTIVHWLSFISARQGPPTGTPYTALGGVAVLSSGASVSPAPAALKWRAR